MLLNDDKEKVSGYTRQELEILRKDAKEKFEELKAEWTDNLLWTLPRRARFLLSDQNRLDIKGYHIFDGTHVLSHRSFVAGFLEGNTSASRPWMRWVHRDADRNRHPKVRGFLDKLTMSSLANLNVSNFYHEAAQFYYDFGAVNTGCHIIKRRGNVMHFFTLLPGSYYVINNAFSEPEILVREFSLDAIALVKRYGKKKNGNWDWSIFSQRVKELYDVSDTKSKIECVEIYLRNKDFKVENPVGGSNRQWSSITYETGITTSTGFQSQVYDPPGKSTTEFKYLELSNYRRRPFILGKAQGELYGERGPTTDAIDLIRSLNKKAVSKDIAIEKMLDPTMQGPAGLHKSYITTQARRYIGLDATALAQGGMRTAYDINPAIGTLTADVMDMRNQVEKFFYADFLLFLSNNPKTRTATEAQAVIDEQRSVVGPNLQSLNQTYNRVVAEYSMDFSLENDPFLGPIPEELAGEEIEVEFTSVFAQVQRAFDLPQINSYVDRWIGLAQLNPQAWSHINLQTLADIYEDRYQLPVNLNNPASKVEALMQQAQQDMQRQQMMQNLPGIAQAGKNVAEAQALSGGENVPAI